VVALLRFRLMLTAQSGVSRAAASCIDLCTLLSRFLGCSALLRCRLMLTAQRGVSPAATSCIDLCTLLSQFAGYSAVLQTNADGATRRESRSNELRVKQMDAASYEERLQQVRRPQQR
jgi:hypothetical protein